MPVGHFLAGVATAIWLPAKEQYLLLRRSEMKDYAPGAWECLTGRVDQGESFADALHREVREELGLSVQVAHILGTTHFYRGAPSPENELLGVVYLCLLDETRPISLSPEHSEFRWLTARQSLELLSASDPSTRWARRVIERAEAVRLLLPGDLMVYQMESGFELG
jgi:8-oxo-dGTP diphosphatase